MVYLDYNATAPYSPSVVEFIRSELVDCWANPSSEYALGLAGAEVIKSAREKLGETLGVSPKGLIFTSGATESINTVLSFDNLSNHGIKRIISSPLEHSATLDQLKYLAKHGIEIVWIKNDSEGQLDLDSVSQLVQNHSLVTILHANNEIGTIHPIKEITQIVHDKGGLIHIDAVQALGKIPVDLDDLDVDFASFSGHKIGSMKGIGALFVKALKKFSPLLRGGGQERGYRPGTLNAAAIKSFALALKDIDLDKMKALEDLRNSFEIEVRSKLGAQVNGGGAPRLPNTSNIFLEGRSSRDVLMKLSKEKIYVSVGSACSSGSFEPSHVIRGLGFSNERGFSSLRISMGYEIERAHLNGLIGLL